MILSKELSNINHLFDNCEILKKFCFSDDEINMEDEAHPILEEDNDYDKDLDFNENGNNNSENSLYKNLRTDDTYSNCSEITTKTKMKEKYYNSTINYVREKKIIYQHNYYYDMSYVFYNCSLLSSLPDISKWNASNVNNMSEMLYNCSSLSSLPDISNWNTNNVEDMSNLFYNCSSLLSLPNISKWNTNNVEDMSGMFYNCILLLHIPNLQ